MRNNGSFWGRLAISTLNGLPLNFVSKQLPFKSWFNLTTLLHIHLHSKYNSNNRLDKDKKNSRGFTIEKISLLQELIYNSIYKWKKAYQYNDHWNSYYDNDIESSEYLNEKEAVIRKWLETIKPRSVVDLGANTGRFSFIAGEYAERVIALEEDHHCVDIIEKRIAAHNCNNVVALIGNLSEPTPNLGLLNKEKENIYSRANSQMALGLALTHHLYITNKMSSNQIAEVFNSFSSEYVIMEFIGTGDSKVEILARNCKDRLDDYNEVNCIGSMKKYFNLVESKKIEETTSFKNEMYYDKLTLFNVMEEALIKRVSKTNGLQEN
jgi:FkbM family methyltransferase